jgi:hypothetical protein
MLKEKRHSTQGRSYYSVMVIKFVTELIKNPLKLIFIQIDVS